MSDLKRKLSSLKNTLKTPFKNAPAPAYKRFYNYIPDNPFPSPDQTYKKYSQPKPPKGGRRKRKHLGGKRKQLGGRKRKQKGGKRRGGRSRLVGGKGKRR